MFTWYNAPQTPLYHRVAWGCVRSAASWAQPQKFWYGTWGMGPGSQQFGTTRPATWTYSEKAKCRWSVGYATGHELWIKHHLFPGSQEALHKAVGGQTLSEEQEEHCKARRTFCSFVHLPILSSVLQILLGSITKHCFARRALWLLCEPPAYGQGS